MSISATMYEGRNNSPKTTIQNTNGISPSDLSVTVDDASKLNITSLPNLATISTSDNAEVILITAVSGNTLTILRGQGGTTAGTWAAGTEVYRAFTKLDHDAIRTNITSLESTKLETTGNGSSVTASFTESTNRENIATGETLASLFGKLKKWYSSLSAFAWKSKIDAGDFNASAVATNDIANSAVTSAKIASGAVTAGKIGAGAIVNADVSASAAIAYSKLSGVAASSHTHQMSDISGTFPNDNITITAGSISGTAITDATVSTAKLADGLITTAKLADDAVTSVKLADDAVTADAIVAGAVTNAKIAAGAVTNAKIGSGEVKTANLAEQAVTTDKLANGAVTNAKVATGAAIEYSKLSGVAPLSHTHGGIEVRPNYTISSTPIAEGDDLDNGVIYLYYEEEEE